MLTLLELLTWLPFSPAPAPIGFLPLSSISISSQQISVTHMNSPDGQPPILEGDEEGEEEEGGGGGRADVACSKCALPLLPLSCSNVI